MAASYHSHQQYRSHQPYQAYPSTHSDHSDHSDQPNRPNQPNQPSQLNHPNQPNRPNPLHQLHQSNQPDQSYQLYQQHQPHQPYQLHQVPQSLPVDSDRLAVGPWQSWLDQYCADKSLRAPVYSIASDKRGKRGHGRNYSRDTVMMIALLALLLFTQSSQLIAARRQNGLVSSSQCKWCSIQGSILVGYPSLSFDKPAADECTVRFDGNYITNAKDDAAQVALEQLGTPELYQELQQQYQAHLKQLKRAQQAQPEDSRSQPISSSQSSMSPYSQWSAHGQRS